MGSMKDNLKLNLKHEKMWVEAYLAGICLEQNAV